MYSLRVLKRLESFAGHPLPEHENSIFCTVCSSLIMNKTSSIRNHLKAEKHLSNVKAATNKVHALLSLEALRVDFRLHLNG